MYNISIGRWNVKYTVLLIWLKIDYANKAQANVQSGHFRIYGDFFTSITPLTFISVHILEDESSRAGITACKLTLKYDTGSRRTFWTHVRLASGLEGSNFNANVAIMMKMWDIATSYQGGRGLTSFVGTMNDRFTLRGFPILGRLHLSEIAVHRNSEFNRFKFEGYE